MCCRPLQTILDKKDQGNKAYTTAGMDSGAMGPTNWAEQLLGMNIRNAKLKDALRKICFNYLRIFEEKLQLN